MAEQSTTEVVTYTKANGKQAMTTVTPVQKQELSATGRLVRTHKTA